MSRVFLLLVVLAVTGCSRPQPSPEYSAARERHAALVAAHPSDAATRPEMDEVLALLARVPEKSADAAAAKELGERILGERKAAREQESRRAALVTKAGESPSWPAESSIGRPPPRAAPIVPGTSIDDFRAMHGACFERRGEVRIVAADGKERAGESWGLKDGDEDCGARYAAQRGQVVLVADGAVVGVRPESDGKAVKQEQTMRRTERRDVELVPMEGGKWGVRGTDGKVEPVPEGAEVRTRDGAPLTAPRGTP